MWTSVISHCYCMWWLFDCFLVYQ